MSQGAGWLDRRVVAYTEWLIRWRWAVVAASVLVALAAGFGGQFLSFSTNYQVFFSPQNPQLQAYESLQRIYIRDDNISIVIHPNQGDVFQPDLLRDVRALTEEAWQVPYTTRVDSITNFQNSTAVGDDLVVQDLVPGDSPLDTADLARIRKAALSEPLLANRLIAPDAKTLSVNVTVTLPLKSETEIPEAMTKARALADGFQKAHPEVHVALTGSVALDHAFSEAAEGDLQTLVPLMYGVLLLVMAVLLRSVGGTVATLLVIGMSAMTAMGLSGWLGILLTPPSVTAPTIILTLAIADSIHILVTTFQLMRRGADKRSALVESMKVNFEPVFLTSLTTLIGFLSLNFSDAPPFRDLGNITAMGVAAAWLYSVAFLPAVMAILPVRIKQRPIGYASAMDRLSDFVVGRRRLVLGTMVVLVVGLGALVPRIELNDQFVNYFDRSMRFRQDTDFAMQHLSGIYQAQWSLPAPGPGAINDPEYLAQVQAFTKWLRGHPGVVHVQTITDVFDRLNRNMHGDDPAWYRLPTVRELAAQYLLLFEMSLPYGLDLNNQINVDKSATRIVATLENITTNQLRALDDEASDWFRQNLPSAAETRASGPFVMFAYIAKRNIEGMLTGTFAAFVLISASMMLALRSVRLGLISLVPNLVPAAMAFGVWSVLVGQIGLASSVVTATSLGIIVDATVHFLSKYQRARRTTGADAEGAVRYAFSTVGTALWVTTAVLIAGFAVLSFSTFEINASLGQLTAITLFMGIIADFFLLPTLLMMLAGRDGRSSTQQPVEQAAE